MNKHVKKYAGNKAVGLFEQDETIQKLQTMGNPLEALSQVVDFEVYRDILEKALLTPEEEKKSNAGRKPLDPVFVCKVLFLQRFYGLSDEQLEYQIADRTSFRKFLGIQNVDDVPDAKTIWRYRDVMSDKGTFDEIFALFHQELQSKGLIFNEGKIIDASFVVAPRQRNTREENKKIKKGQGDTLWNDNPHKKCHKDIDARWTKKGGERFYGYKGHIKADAKGKQVDDYSTTPANVHDSKGLKPLLDKKDKGQDMLLDSGYVGTEVLIRKVGMNPKICARAYRNHPLTDAQKAYNKEISKMRCRIEHIFGFAEGTMKGLVVRSIGLVCAKANVALTCWVYNICRYIQIKKNNPEWIRA